MFILIFFASLNPFTVIDYFGEGIWLGYLTPILIAIAILIFLFYWSLYSEILYLILKLIFKKLNRRLFKIIVLSILILITLIGATITVLNSAKEENKHVYIPTDSLCTDAPFNMPNCTTICDKYSYGFDTKALNYKCNKDYLECDCLKMNN